MKTKSTTVSTRRVADAIRYAPNPIPQLTPKNLAAYLDSFARGYLRDTGILWNAIQWRDDRVAADAGKRCKSISRYGYAVEPADGSVTKSSKRAVQRHVDAITYALENLTALDVLDGSVRGGVTMLCRQMMRAIGMQYQVHELVWRTTPQGVTLQASAMPLWWFERTIGRLRFLQQDLAIEGVDLEPDGWMVTRGDGLMAPTSVLYLFKRMSLTDWALYNGRVGPGIHAKTSASKDSDQWRDLEDAVDGFDFDLKIVTGDGVSISPIEMALKGTLPWPQMYDAMVKAITILWRGGNLMTDSAGSAAGGEQKGVSLQGGESVLLEQDDAEMISDAINDYIVTPLIRFRFNEEPLAWVQWNTAPRTDIAADRATDEFLAGRGFPFSLEDLSERYGRRLPAEGDTPAVPPAAAPAPLPIHAANADPVDLESATARLVPAAVAETAAIRARLAEPWIRRLQELAARDLPEAEFLDAVEALVRELPSELLTRDAIAALAVPLEGLLGASVVNALISSGAGTPSAANAFDPSQARDQQGRWTTSEGFSAVPLAKAKRVNLDTEVVWRDADGRERHGQLGFHEELTTRSGSEIRSERTGRTFVHEVTVEHSTDASGRRVRKLVPVKSGTLIPGPTGSPTDQILVPTDQLHVVMGGFKGREHP